MTWTLSRKHLQPIWPARAGESWWELVQSIKGITNPEDVGKLWETVQRQLQHAAKKCNSNAISGNPLAFLPPRKSSATPVASICPAIHPSRTWNSFTTPKRNLIRNTTQLKQCKCPGRLLHCIMPYLWNWVRIPGNFWEYLAKISNLLDLVPTRPCKCSYTYLRSTENMSKDVKKAGSPISVRFNVLICSRARLFQKSFYGSHLGRATECSGGTWRHEALVLPEQVVVVPKLPFARQCAGQLYLSQRQYWKFKTCLNAFRR